MFSLLPFLLLSPVALLAANIVAVALELPWYAQPVGALRWLCVDLGSRAATWLGQHLARLFAELARRLTDLFERLWPAVKTTAKDCWAVGTAGFEVAGAFFRGWALLEYPYKTSNTINSFFQNVSSVLLALLRCRSLRPHGPCIRPVVR